MNYFLEVIKQIFILLKKNALLYLRRWKSTTLQLLSPILILAVLVILSVISEANFGGKASVYQPVTPLHSIKVPTQEQTEQGTSLQFYNCTKWNKNVPCYKLAMTSNGIPFGATLLDQLVTDYNLQQDVDYKNFTSRFEMETWLYEHQNQTNLAISFIPNQVYDSINTISYLLYYNRSKTDLKVPVLSLQNIMDNNIIYYRMKQLNRSSELQDFRNAIKVDYKNLPQPPTRKNGQVIIYNSTGPTFFSIGAMIILIVSLNSLVVEKEGKLRFAMIMMGMKDSAYFISCFSLVCFAFLLSTFIKESKSALVLGFTVLAISFILNLFVSNGNVVYQLYSTSVTPAFRVILSFYPPFNFAKVFTDIATKTLPVYDDTLRKFVPGPGYSFDDFFTGTNTYDYVPPSYLGIIVLILNGLLFLILYWYCDNVFSDGSGVRKSPIFFIFPSYWGLTCLKKKSTIKTNETQDELDYSQMETNDVKEEFKHSRDSSINAVVRIVSLRQTYSGFLTKLAAKCFPSKIAQSRFFREKKALKGLNLVVEDNQCVSLLGHNGAGKTSTMNILTGLFKQTSGEAYIAGLDVRNSIQQIRKQLGMCPQHDILWDDLTAEEHLELFGDMKGVPRKERNNEIRNLLESVDLLDVGHHLTKTYSGGMKRRLSICIACIGSPKLILLDEPTTGLDPFSRKKAWNLIHKMKKGRAMILTTHAMDEADYLSDRIAIMAHGQLKCIGDSLSIKSQYGSGYNLLVVANNGYEKQVVKMINQYLSSVKIVSQSAGNFIFNVPKEQLNELGQLISHLEKLTNENTNNNNSNTGGGAGNVGTSNMIKDWGISQTTLEEVYLKVTQKSEFSYKNDDNAISMGNMSEVAEEQELIEHQNVPNVASLNDVSEMTNNANNIEEEE